MLLCFLVIMRPPTISTLTDPLCPYPTLVRSWRFLYIPSRCAWIPKQVRDDRKRTNRSLARPPFLPEPVPIGQPLGDLHFKAARRRGVEALRQIGRAHV